MFHINFSLFADLMVWGTVPLMAVLGYWEHQLRLTEMEHKLVLVMLVVFVFVWAHLWINMGERDRLARYKPCHSYRPLIHYIEPEILNQGGPIRMSGDSARNLATKTDGPIKYVEQRHASNH